MLLSSMKDKIALLLSLTFLVATLFLGVDITAQADAATVQQSCTCCQCEEAGPLGYCMPAHKGRTICYKTGSGCELAGNQCGSGAE